MLRSFPSPVCSDPLRPEWAGSIMDMWLGAEFASRHAGLASTPEAPYKAQKAQCYGMPAVVQALTMAVRQFVPVVP